jgi:HNH endonuclease
VADALPNDYANGVVGRGESRRKHPGVPRPLRDAVYERDGFACVYCGITGDQEQGVVITVDHVVPVYFGGSHLGSNLVTACDTCNWMKSIYPLDLWVQLAERLGYGDSAVIEHRVRAALARKLRVRK